MDNLTGTVSQETRSRDEMRMKVLSPSQKPGWVSVEGDPSGGRRMVVSFSSLDGLRSRVKTLLFRRWYRYSGWQTFKQKKRCYLSNGVLASKRWVKG